MTGRLLGEVAGDRPPASRAPQDRLDLLADLRVAEAAPEPAPGMEAAAGGRTIEARDFAGQDDLAASAGARVEGGGKERDRVRVRRVGIHLVHASHFNDPAEI